jgi:hypothetical protein
VAMMAIEGGIARNNLQLWRERNLLRFLLQVYLWSKTIFLLHIVVLGYWIPDVVFTFAILYKN